MNNKAMFVKRSPATHAGWTLLAAVLLLASPALYAAEIPDQFKIGGFALGCQAWSFNRYTAYEAIEKTAEVGGKVIEFYPGQRLRPDDPKIQLHHTMPAEAIEELKAKLERHGILAVNYGVVWLGKDEARCRRVFAFAKTMGMLAVTSEPDAGAMDLFERLVKEYDIKLAIHNHPRKMDKPDYRYWDPEYVKSLVQGRDSRIGACADTGHWVRSGIKPVDALKILEGRIVSSHLKDLHEFSPRGRDAPFGTGVSDIRGILRELKRQKFSGNISIEYEHNWSHSMPEIAQCIGFIRGAGLSR